MGGQAGHRLRGGALVALAILALAGGGYWWHAQAPAVPSAAEGGTPLVSAGAASASAAPAPAEGPWRAPRRWGVAFIDAGTGRVIADPAEPHRADPATGRVVTGSGRQVDGSDWADIRWWVLRESGGFREPVWQARLTLLPGRPPQRRVLAVVGGPHLLQYRCVGPGRELVLVTRARVQESRRVRCDGRLGTLWLHSADGQIRLWLAPGGTAPVVVDARLAAVFPSR